MKNLIKILIFPSLLIVVSGCTNLDEDLRGEITKDISLPGIGGGPGGGGGDVLEGAFSGLRNVGSANHSSYYSIQEITSDEMVICAKGGDWFDGGILIDLHKHTYAATHGFINNAWNGHYSAINTCNELLSSGTLDAGLTAQVKALRAYYYLRMCDLYGNVKIITTPGVDAPQAKRTEVFNFIEKELLEALGVPAVSSSMDLSNSPLGTGTNKYRINIYGALGILTQLYINGEVYTGNKYYDKAEIAATYIIDNGGYTLCGDGCSVVNLGRRPSVASDPERLVGYAAVFAPNNENNPENIFTIRYDEATATGMNFSQMNLHYSSQFTWNFDSQPWNGYATLEDFYNSYENVDVRKKANFIVGPQTDFSGSPILDYASDDGELQLNYNPKINELAPNSQREAGARPGKFSYKQLGRPDMDNDFPIVRLGDIYLLRGEARARNAGDWSLSLSDVNMLRRRAKVSELTQINADIFLAERGREMFQEAVRRTDLIRFGKYNSVWWEKPVSAPHTTLFPIPFDAIQSSNGTLEQNPGY